MPATAVPVDAEALVADFLRADSAVASIVSARVYTRIPDVPVWPLIRITRNGGSPVFQVPLFLDAARIQIEAWAGLTDDGKAVAWDLIAKVQRSLHALNGIRAGFGVVSGVDTELGPIYEPDPDTDRARFLLAVRVYTHPSAS